MPFGVESSPDTEEIEQENDEEPDQVTNAFRRRVLTGRVIRGLLGPLWIWSPMPFGVESSPDPSPPHGPRPGAPSPMPFGVESSPDLLHHQKI